ncbi:PREDICTED: sialin-like isoform X3 [Trachymyrmex cornetzi]|uniref:sialin-like isoform X3 n=1 Tax=Trachymyrmex cornetzi TaxID=471704 RepID=UPI00084EDD02|nr:PREDICTED: sialin-like isoform X3 [Trachymyrmex cornetzi]
MEESQRHEESDMYKEQPPCSFRKLGDMIPARVVLYMLSFSGFLVSFMMRTDINIAMVAMAKLPSTSDNETAVVTSQCNTISNTSYSENTTVIRPEDAGEFEWSPTIQSAILSSFYWCYILSQMLGGVLTQYFGTKTIFGGSQVITAVCSLLMPTAAEIHYGAMIALRSIQGFASGLTWPAMYAVIGHWIPPVERSRFMSSFQGFSIGIGLTYPLCAFIIAHFGWRIVFYTTGTISLVWCIFWYLCAFDTPALHPRISKPELRYIQECVRNQVIGADEDLPVPWKSILTSLPAWAIGITTFGRIWVHYVFIIPGPMYMKTVLGFSIQANGILSGAPFICSYLSSVVFCYVADLLVTRQIMTLITVRKINTALSQVVPGILMVLIGYLGCDIILVLIVWFIAVTLITAGYAGAMASVVDIAPNFAGPVLAFAQTIHMTASFLSPIAAGLLTQESQSLDSWRRVFAVTAGVSCSTYIAYQIFGTADIQAWNYPDQKYPQSIREECLLNDSTKKKSKIVPIAILVAETSAKKSNKDVESRNGNEKEGKVDVEHHTKDKQSKKRDKHVKEHKKRKNSSERNNEDPSEKHSDAKNSKSEQKWRKKQVNGEVNEEGNRNIENKLKYLKDKTGTQNKKDKNAKERSKEPETLLEDPQISEIHQKSKRSLKEEKHRKRSKNNEEVTNVEENPNNDVPRRKTKHSKSDNSEQVNDAVHKNERKTKHDKKKRKEEVSKNTESKGKMKEFFEADVISTDSEKEEILDKTKTDKQEVQGTSTRSKKNRKTREVVQEEEEADITSADSGKEETVDKTKKDKVHETSKECKKNKKKREIVQEEETEEEPVKENFILEEDNVNDIETNENEHKEESIPTNDDIDRTYLDTPSDSEN